MESFALCRPGTYAPQLCVDSVARIPEATGSLTLSLISSPVSTLLLSSQSPCFVLALNCVVVRLPGKESFPYTIEPNYGDHLELLLLLMVDPLQKLVLGRIHTHGSHQGIRLCLLIGW